LEPAGRCRSSLGRPSWRGKPVSVLLRLLAAERGI
jgi:hypothetical protein